MFSRGIYSMTAWFQEIQATCTSHSWRRGWGWASPSASIYLNPLGGNPKVVDGDRKHIPMSSETRLSLWFLFWDLRPAEAWSERKACWPEELEKKFQRFFKGPVILKTTSNSLSIGSWVTHIFPSLPRLKPQVWISIVRVRCQWRKSNRLLLRLELGHVVTLL